MDGVAKGVGSGAGRHPLDAMTVSREHHDILMENDQVRVLDTRLGPGERTALHAHQWPAALYVLSWSDFVRRGADGAVLADSRTMGEPPAPGGALWIAPLPPHDVENVGDRVLHIIAVEVKAGAPGA